MNPEIQEAMKSFTEVSKITLKWYQNEITAQLAMEQIMYIVIDIPKRAG